MKKMTVLFAMVMIFGIVGVTNAAIVTTAPEINGYSWLEFDVTQGMSRAYVEANLLGAGQEYEGYRYASRLETELLLDSYYVGGSGDLHDDGMDQYWYWSTHDAAYALIRDFGSTYAMYPNYTSEDTAFGVMFYYGLDIETPGGDNQTFRGDVRYGDHDRSFGQEYGRMLEKDGAWAGADLSNYWWFDDASNGMTASLLVHTPVPVPPSMLLLSSGLAGLAGFRRKFKK